MNDKLDAIPGSAGRKIIDGLKDAVEGNFASVTIEGQRWVRDPAPAVLSRNELAEAIHHGRFKDREPTPFDSDRLDREYAFRIADSVIAATKSAPDGTSSLPSGESELSVTTAYAGADTPSRLAAMIGEPDAWQYRYRLSSEWRSMDLVPIDAFRSANREDIDKGDMLVRPLYVATTSPDHSPDAGNMVAEPSRPTASSVEPVAWQTRYQFPNGQWDIWHHCSKTVYDQMVEGKPRGLYSRNELRPLYATPPSSGNADAVRAALIKIAFDAEVNGLAGNPTKWPSTIAYLALGGRISEGVHLDTEESLAALSSAPVAGESPPIEGTDKLMARKIEDAWDVEPTPFNRADVAVRVVRDEMARKLDKLDVLSRNEREGGAA